MNQSAQQELAELERRVAADPWLHEDYGSRMTLIIWWPIVETVSKIDPVFPALMAQGQRFPDGTVGLSSTKGIAGFWKLRKERGLALCQNTQFRSTACFPKREYTLLTTVEYFDRIGGEQQFHVTPITFADEAAPTEMNPAALPIEIKFRRRPTKETPAELLASLRKWEESVSERGIFGGGPARLIADSFAANGKTCSFTVDVSKSDQNTLNWLILSLLNFGAERFPISEVGCGFPL